MSRRAKPRAPGTDLAVRRTRRRSADRVRLGLFERGRLRRRVRFLRKQRELGLRDLGGLIFDMYRFGSKRQDLVREKLRAMFEADRELREFEGLLGRRERVVEIREAGVGGSCPRCLSLYSSDSRFCSRCGLDFSQPAEGAIGVVEAVATPAPEATPQAEAEAAEQPPEPEPPEPEPAEPVEPDPAAEPEPAAFEGGTPTEVHQQAEPSHVDVPPEAGAQPGPPDVEGNGQPLHPRADGAPDEQLTTEIEADRLASRSADSSSS